jgi:hypothetical protein
MRAVTGLVASSSEYDNKTKETAQKHENNNNSSRNNNQQP